MAKRTHLKRVITVDDLPVEYLHCRAFGHTWEEFVPVGMRKPEWGFRFSLLCTHCQTERHDLIDVAGNVGQREYRYMPDYQLDVATNRAEVRLMYEHKRPRSKIARRGSLSRAT
jgi:hypothetical protein